MRSPLENPSWVSADGCGTTVVEAYINTGLELLPCVVIDDNPDTIFANGNFIGDRGAGLCEKPNVAS